jgi:hypothetical protein
LQLTLYFWPSVIGSHTYLEPFVCTILILHFTKDASFKYTLKHFHHRFLRILCFYLLIRKLILIWSLCIWNSSTLHYQIKPNLAGLVLGWSCFSTVILPPSNMVIVTKDRNFHKVPHMELQLYLGVKILHWIQLKKIKT